MTSREEVPARVAEIVGRRARWAPPGRCVAGYDGCERTLEIFDADAGDQLALLRALRAERGELERAAGGPLVVLFHTSSETRRLYDDDRLERASRTGRSDARAEENLGPRPGPQAAKPVKAAKPGGR